MMYSFLNSKLDCKITINIELYVGSNVGISCIVCTRNIIQIAVSMTAYLLLSNMASRLQNAVWTVKSVETLNLKYIFINNPRDFTKVFLIKGEQNSLNFRSKHIILFYIFDRPSGVEGCVLKIGNRHVCLVALRAPYISCNGIVVSFAK